MNLTIKEIILFGWNTTKKNYMNVLFVFALTFLINGVLQFAIEVVGGKGNLGGVLGVILTLAFVFIDVLFQIGVTKEALVIIRGGEGDIKKTFSYSRLFFKAVFAWIVYGIFLVGIFVAIIIPFMIVSFLFKSIFVLIAGFIIALVAEFLAVAVLGFSRTIVIDRETGPLESLRLSILITKGVVKKLILIFLFLALFNLLGLILFVVGLLITVPVTYFSILFVYNSLLLRQNK
ncbi:MAG: hypothetical protein WC629_02180 [Candidatus Paceibacterota bacterium]|jgi:hypothetical protein